MGIDLNLAEEKDERDAAHQEKKAAEAEERKAAETEAAANELSLEDYFQHFVLEHQDHMTETDLARKLGISRKCLWERRQRFGIPRRKASDT